MDQCHLLMQKVSNNFKLINLTKWHKLYHLFMISAFKNNKLDNYDSSCIDTLITACIEQVAKRPFKQINKDSLHYEDVFKC